MAPLPDGWLGCPETSVKLVEDLFFAFKTPLENFSNTSFTIQSVFDYAEKQNWKLGLWIDLTYTEKYFSRKTIAKWNVQYVKLSMEGRRSPTEAQTAEFINHCTTFIKNNPGSVIGVHCTHGFNRTGFLICSFLSHVKKYNPIEALNKFSEARPPGIYRQMMVNDLINRYSSSKSLEYWHVSHNVPWKEKVAAPVKQFNSLGQPPRRIAHTPRIAHSATIRNPNTNLLNGIVRIQTQGHNNNNSTDPSVVVVPGKEGGVPPSSTVKKKKTKKRKKSRWDTEEKGQNFEVKSLEETCKDLKKNLLISFPTYLNNYPGVQKINDDTEKQEILQELQSLVELPTSSTSSSSSLSPSFEFQKEMYLTQENFSILQENHETYSVTWCPQEYYKYLLFVNSKHEAYMINTQNSIYRVPSLKFPDLGSTILEGLVLRRRKSTEDNIGWFSLEITNVLAFQGKIFKDMSHRARQDCIQKSILCARLHLDTKQEPFTVQMKHMWAFRNLGKLQTFKWSSHYFCPPNGLIFYPHSSEKQVFYWRCPDSVNSAHFRLFLEHPIETEDAASTSSSSITKNPRVLLHVDEQEQPFSELSLEADSISDVIELNGRIVECIVEKSQDNCNEKVWNFKREATNRMHSDSLELVSNLRDGVIENNVKMNVLFVKFLVPKKRKKVDTNTATSSDNSTTTTTTATIINNDNSYVESKS